MQDRRLKAGRVSIERTEVVKHEVLFEDDVTQIRDHGFFVGHGIPEHRKWAALGIVLLILASLIMRAGWMQIVHASEYRELADNNRFRIDVLPARRGIIRDLEGEVLAENVPSFNVRMRWIDLPLEDDERQRVLSRVGRIIGMTSQEITEMLTEDDDTILEWIDVAKDISYERAIDLSVELPNMSGVALIDSAKRRYPFSAEVESLSHILGYVGSISAEEYDLHYNEGYRRADEIGKAGIEKSYESRIRGDAGERRIEVDAFGRPVAAIEERNPTDGDDMTLTIDVRLQKAVQEALRKGIEEAEVFQGSAIVMDAKTGAIRAAVSWPAYDNNLFTGKVSSTLYSALINDEHHPLFPRAWQGQFPSGSVIKPLIAIAALQEGIVTPNTTVLSNGGIWVGPWFFPDWQAGGHGLTNVRRAIAWSVNTFFYYVGGGYGDFRGLGISKLSEWMKNFGLGSPTGIDVPGEASGHVPSQEWKEEIKGEHWYIGDTYNLSIGQGDLLVTPLQIARVTATIANGGTLVTPHFVQGEGQNPPTVSADADVWKTVQLGMQDTVEYGSGRRLTLLSFSSAGKTGTAQWRSDRPNHAWFTGFAPFEDPEIVVTVLVEEGEEGSSVASPITYEILKAWKEIQDGAGE